MAAKPTTPPEVVEEPANDLASVLKRKSTAPVFEDGRMWNPAKVPYRVNGKRVTREEYVAHERALAKKALKEELAIAVAEDLANPPTPPADLATSKE